MYIFVVALSPLAGSVGERVEACHGLAELNLDVKLTWFLSVDPRTLDFDPNRLARACDANLMNGWTAWPKCRAPGAWMDYY
jgi:hypothetical protein